MIHSIKHRVLLGAVLCCLLIAGPARSSPQDTWTVNFNNTDINELIKFVADATGKTIIVDPKVKGQVDVVSQRPLTTPQLYDLFLSILTVHGYVAVESGGVVKVIDEKAARTQASDVSAKETNAGYITHVIQLENIAAAKLIPVLRPLVPQQAHLAAYAPSNAIIITDTGDNIRRIRQIIEQIDTAAVEETNIIRLKHASADEVVNLINRLEQQRRSGGAATADAGQEGFSIAADKRTNSVLINGDEVQRARLKTMVRYLDVPLQESGNATVIYLEYASAVDVAEVLGRVLSNISRLEADKTKETTAKTSAVVEADEATNALIVTADPDVMKTIQAVVAKLDIRRAQVLVEAILVEVKNIDSKQLGVEWLFADDNGVYGSNSNADGVLGAVTGGLLGGDGVAGAAAALAGNPGGALGVGRVNSNGFSFNMLLRALQEDTDTNILSTPSLLTLDNNEASIVVGQEVPFKTGSYTNTGGGTTPLNPFETIERRDVGITLKVTPQINEGDSIVMEIVQEVSDVTDSTLASDVITNKREITTTVLSDNGETIVLGGLIQDSLKEGVRKVPLLGDIPWLGRLFRSSGTNLEKTNLMVFIRPTIVRDRKVLRGASAAKYEYMRDQQLRGRDDGVDLMPDDVMPVLPAWQEQIRYLEKLRSNTYDSR